MRNSVVDTVCVALACGLFALGWPVRADAQDERLLAGFRLLDLDGAGVKWQRRSGDAEPRITYAFVRSERSFPGARNCRGLSSFQPLLDKSAIRENDFRREARAAFDLWQGAARLSFEEVDEAQGADILLGAQSEPSGHAFTDVAYRSGAEPVRQIERSLICLNPAKRWKIGFDGNLSVYDLRYTLAHEIGHAIGLDHPDGAGSLMSFRYQEASSGLRRGDLAGVAALYGAREAGIETGSIAPMPVNAPRGPGSPEPRDSMALGPARTDGR